MSDSLIIEIEKLNKFYGVKSNRTHILQDISLSVRSGEFVGITGTSGSGKSTFLSILGLLDSFDSGDYFLSKTNVKSLDSYQVSKLRADNIGWIFQQFNLVSDMTALENVVLALKYTSKFSPLNHDKIAREKLSEVGLDAKFDLYPGQLSGGQQQRVAIARALATEPDFILADEPTGNLDSKNSELIVDLLSELNSNGVTIILVTHSLDVARNCSKRFTMEDGQLSGE